MMAEFHGACYLKKERKCGNCWFYYVVLILVLRVMVSFNVS